MNHHDIEAHFAALTRFAIRLTRNSDAANDLVQDMILKVLSRPASAELPDNTKSYMMTVLHNLFIDTYRKQSRRSFVPIDDVEPIASDAPQNLALASKEVLAAITALPSDFSDVLFRHARDDQSYAEIADALNIPLGTVMSRMSRARSSLRTLLDDDATGLVAWDVASSGSGYGDTGF